MFRFGIIILLINFHFNYFAISESIAPDFRETPFDLKLPHLVENEFGPGIRTKARNPKDPKAVYHVLYLPSDWEKGKKYPVIVEYAGNGPYHDKNGDKSKIVLSLKEVIKNKNSTYSPLALYFLIDNNLIDNRKEINDLFDIIINEISLEEEIKNLIIYKKALYNADYINENLLLEILNPIINSKSVWKSHALYLLAEYFYSKNEKQKSKEFFSLILSLENANQDLIKEAQKRLNRDLSE